MNEYPLFEVMLEFNPKGIKRLELHSSSITNCNEEFAESIGYAREELIGQPLNKISLDENIEDFSEFSSKEKFYIPGKELTEKETIKNNKKTRKVKK